MSSSSSGSSQWGKHLNELTTPGTFFGRYFDIVGIVFWLVALIFSVWSYFLGLELGVIQSSFEDMLGWAVFTAGPVALAGTFVAWFLTIGTNMITLQNQHDEKWKPESQRSKKDKILLTVVLGVAAQFATMHFVGKFFQIW